MCGLYEGQLGRHTTGQEPRKKGLVSGYFTVPCLSFPFHQSEERWQVPGSAALPALAELPSPQAGSHLSPGKGSGQELLQPGSPRREQSFPHTGKMFTHPQRGKTALSSPST